MDERTLDTQGGVGGTLNFVCYIGYDYFWGLRVLNFTSFGGLGKKWLFLGCWTYAGTFLGATLKTDYLFGFIKNSRYFWGKNRG